jgi:serine/threonine protein kinase
MKPSMNVTSPTVQAMDHGVPRPGLIIADRYKLDRLLERGAMGSVWRAEQVRLRAPVAIKFLDPSLIGDKEMHDRFIQEARSSAAVRSAHVVQVFDYGTEDGVPYIAMELLYGENLDARLGARGTLTPAELSKLFSEIARGIGQAHASGVIHRDLKPGNIFIAREGEHEVTKIVDFGIAKVKASALRLTQGVGTQLGTLLGTPQYMSPEQVRGSGSIDHRTDLWALAVIACECLTGRCPFSGATIGDLTVQICTEKPPAPSSLGPVPPGFDQWFFKATHKKPSKRFQTVEEMSERLQAVLAPAILAAPGGARAGRRIAFPSRSEVRLAYSAVVTWKGYVMSRLSQSWVELRRMLVRLGRHLSSELQTLRQRSSALRESGRLKEGMAVLSPVIRRHGVLASVALLCAAILLLGLTATSGDPTAVSARPANAATTPLAPNAPAKAALALRALATPKGVTASGDGTRLTEPDPGAPNLATGGSTASEALGTSGVSAAPALGSSDPAATPPLDRVVLLEASAEKAALAPSESPRSETQKPIGPRAANGSDPSAQASPQPSARPGADREPSPRAANTDSAKTEAATKDSPAPPPARPITKAMAQAATKILNADELVASLPAKKPAPRVPPRATRPKPTAATAPAKSADPFDDRL